MPEGYIRSQPDSTWWMDQIGSGKEFRKKFAKEAKWERWRAYLRGEWHTDILPVNKFHSIMRSMIPRTYFRTPAVSVMPSQPGFLNMAFAMIVNRIDNKLIQQMQIKYETKDMLIDTFIKGIGIGKLGFGAEFSPAPSGFSNEEPLARDGRSRVEYHSNVFDNMPWFMRVDPGSFVVPDGCRRLREARWCAHIIRRSRDDVVSDPRLTHARDLPASAVIDIKSIDASIMKRIEMVDLIEIRDRKTERAIVLAPFGSGDSKILYNEVDPMQARRFPFFDITFNPDDQVFWGVPDAQILEPQQLETNEIRTQQMKHRRISIVKLLFKNGAITEAEVAKLLSEDVGAAVGMDGNPQVDIKLFQQGQIPVDLVVAGNQVDQDVREMMGISRNQTGEFQTRRGDTSATEAAAVQQGSEIRVDERRDIIADMYVEMVHEMNSLIFNHWTEDQVVDVIGPGGVQVWVKVDPAMLSSSRYAIRVDPDSSSPKTREVREARAMAIYDKLQLNPLIDPTKLTQYLLTELEGVEMDELMRILPAPPGGGGGVLGVGELAGQLQGSLAQISGGGGGAPPQVPAQAGASR